MAAAQARISALTLARRTAAKSGLNGIGVGRAFILAEIQRAGGGERDASRFL